MTALEIAECFELYACDHKPDGWPAIRQGTLNEAAATLRRQHEAIVKLRVALGAISYATEWGGDLKFAQDNAEQALKDTEDLK